MEDKEQEPLDELREFLEAKQKEADQKPKEPAPPSREEACARRCRLVRAAQIAIIAASALFLYAYFPHLSSSLAPQKPLRFGSYATDAGTDKCISSLWRAAAGQQPPGAAVCPVSGEAYKVSGGVISCPNPEKHGLSELYYEPRRGVAAKEAK